MHFIFIDTHRCYTYGFDINSYYSSHFFCYLWMRFSDIGNDCHYSSYSFDTFAKTFHIAHDIATALYNLCYCLQLFVYHIDIAGNRIPNWTWVW